MSVAIDSVGVEDPAPAEFQPHPVLDDPKQWYRTIHPPAGFDADEYQKRIDQIVGVTREGKAIVRLAWCPRIFTRALGEEMPRYWVRRFKVGGGRWEFVSAPRWHFEKRLEKGVYFDAHNATRWQTQDDKSVLDLGEPPDDYYIAMEHGLVARHDNLKVESGYPTCCENAWLGEEVTDTATVFVGVDEKNRPLTQDVATTKRVNARRRCWGYYREPDELDLERLRQGFRQMESEKFYDPYTPMSVEQLAMIEAQASVDAQRMQAEVDNYMAEQSRDFGKLYNWKLDASAKRQHRGKYEFIQQPSGLITLN